MKNTLLEKGNCANAGSLGHAGNDSSVPLDLTKPGDQAKPADLVNQMAESGAVLEIPTESDGPEPPADPGAGNQ